METLTDRLARRCPRPAAVRPPLSCFKGIQAPSDLLTPHPRLPASHLSRPVLGVAASGRGAGRPLRTAPRGPRAGPGAVGPAHAPRRRPASPPSVGTPASGAGGGRASPPRHPAGPRAPRSRRGEGGPRPPARSGRRPTDTRGRPRPPTTAAACEGGLRSSPAG